LTLSYDNPYWTEDGVSRGFDAYNRRTDTTSTSVAGYKTDALGTGVRFGVPISLDDKIYLGTAVDHTRITVSDDSPQLYKNFVEEHGNTVTTLMTTAGWSRDKRDSIIYPTSGTYQRFNTEVAVPPAELRYGRATYQFQRFFPLSSTYTLMLNSEYGIAEAYSGQSVPFYKNFYAGGIGSIRGFKDNSIGAKVYSYTDSDGNAQYATVGGTQRLIGSAEIFFPFPGMKEKDRSLRLSTFVDTGSLWGVNSSFRRDSFRVSTGMGMSWVSPIGPLKFSIGFPLVKREGDDVQHFQFLIGTTM